MSLKAKRSKHPTVYLVLQILTTDGGYQDTIIKAVDTDAELAEAHRIHLVARNCFKDVMYRVEPVSTNHLFADATNRRKKLIKGV